MAVKSSIHIKPCNISSSEAHNLRTPEYMRNIGESKIYLVPQLVADNEHWINPRLGDYDLQTHYDNIKQMVKAKTGRAMQEKERERKTKSGKIIKVAGCSPIREGVLLIKPDTTLDDVRRFGEECQQRWGITPLQIFLHKDEGHWLGGEPPPDDKECFQIGGRWFKPNYHAHIVFDWMDHETGKSRKLNDDDMMQMQTLASETLSMERGQSKTETAKEHLERNDFIIEKQRAELQRIEAERQHKEHHIDLAEQELKQVKSEIRTDKLKSVATDAATALASGVSSLFGSGKMKSLERKNEDLRDEIAIRDETIEQLQSNIKQMQVEHSRAMMNKDNEHRKDLEAKEAKHNEELNFLNSLYMKARRWFPDLADLLKIERECSEIGINSSTFTTLLDYKEHRFNGYIFSPEHRRKFELNNTPFQIVRYTDNRLKLQINHKLIKEWFMEQWEKLRQIAHRPSQLPQRNGDIKL